MILDDEDAERAVENEITSPEPVPIGLEAIQDPGFEIIEVLIQNENEDPNHQIENTTCSDPVVDPKLLSALGESMSDTPDTTRQFIKIVATFIKKRNSIYLSTTTRHGNYGHKQK